MIARENLFYTRDRSRVVTAASPDAFFLLARAGETIGGALIKRFELEEYVVDVLEVDRESTENLEEE